MTAGRDIYLILVSGNFHKIGDTRTLKSWRFVVFNIIFRERIRRAPEISTLVLLHYREIIFLACISIRARTNHYL